MATSAIKLPETLVEYSELKPKSKIEAIFSEDGYWYPATLLHLKGDKARIKWKEGGEEATVKANQVRLLKEKPILRGEKATVYKADSKATVRLAVKFLREFGNNRNYASQLIDKLLLDQGVDFSVKQTKKVKS